MGGGGIRIHQTPYPRMSESIYISPLSCLLYKISDPAIFTSFSQALFLLPIHLKVSYVYVLKTCQSAAAACISISPPFFCYSSNVCLWFVMGR